MISAPGRVNLIGEHIDYHGLAVLPMALRRSIRVQFQPREDRRIQAVSEDYGGRSFEWTPALAPVVRGDWENYLRAAAQAIGGQWGVLNGLDAAIESDLPPAAGLSSSSALIVAVTLAILRANHIEATFEELMRILPDGEQFVGTRGGGMDHAASLASRAGCASLIEFTPLAVHHIPIPSEWAFLVAHSMHTAEKSGAIRERYNAVRAAGAAALAQTGFPSYTAAVAACDEGELAHLADPLAPLMRDTFLHVVTEAHRVRAAVCALRENQPARFGQILLAGHASLRDRLGVSCPALDRLVDAAMASGAIGARLTGAGFGGCAVVFCRRADLANVRDGLIERFYSGAPGHIYDAEPGPGAVNS
ncbi:MAG TPA: galactokinase family protein [Candidatus Solibacter sp.]